MLSFWRYIWVWAANQTTNLRISSTNLLPKKFVIICLFHISILKISGTSIFSNNVCLGNIACFFVFCSFFSKSIFSKSSFRNNFRVSGSLAQRSGSRQFARVISRHTGKSNVQHHLKSSRSNSVQKHLYVSIETVWTSIRVHTVCMEVRINLLIISKICTRRYFQMARSVNSFLAN